jgi:hypothetical protein
VFESDDEQKAFAEERRLISELKTYVYALDHVFGCNYTVGGEGTSGAKHVWSIERRKGASESQKKAFQNVERQKTHAEATTKQWLSADRRTRQSSKMKQHNPSRVGSDTDVTRKRKSESQKKRYKSLSERKKTSLSTMRSCQNSDVRARRSEAQKQRRIRERLEKENHVE